MILTIIIFVIILALLVLSHEFGHFIVAKKSGMTVEEFGFGFPPRLFGVKYGGTLYSFNALPFGGFVKIKGEEGEINEPDSFSAKPASSRLLVLVSGVLFNFILGYVMFVLLALYDVPWHLIFARAYEYLGLSILLTVQAFYGVLQIAVSGGDVSGFISGPVGIVSIVGDTIGLGLPFLIQLTAFLSVNLGIINMLPIPALDGGRILFLLIEIATRKRINPRVSSFAHAIGFAALILLLLIVTFYDINRILN